MYSGGISKAGEISWNEMQYPIVPLRRAIPSYCSGSPRPESQILEPVNLICVEKSIAGLYRFSLFWITIVFAALYTFHIVAVTMCICDLFFHIRVCFVLCLNVCKHVKVCARFLVLFLYVVACFCCKRVWGRTVSSTAWRSKVMR